MTSKFVWRLKQLGRKLWFRATIISLLAVVSALLAFVLTPYLPWELSAKIGSDSVDKILSIIASSMLAVTTFSLSTMVSAYSAATSNVTPRATKLMIEDRTTQNVLATFIGSFLYSLVAIITLSMGAYGDRGRVVLFATTIAVVVLIVVTLVRWIDYLLRLGRVSETSERVESAAMQAMQVRRAQPFLGGVAFDPVKTAIADHARPVFSHEIGYVEHIDVAALNAIVEECEQDGGRIYLVALPGTFVDEARPLALSTVSGEGVLAAIEDAFSVGKERSFEQDPRFGVIVMSEIASRALSPAVNDPGTAIDILGRAVRVLSTWGDKPEKVEPDYPNVSVPPLPLADLFDDFFLPVARDGAGMVEVEIRLQKALAALARIEDPRFGDNARRISALALAHAKHGLYLPRDIEQVEAAAATIPAGKTAARDRKKRARS